MRYEPVMPFDDLDVWVTRSRARQGLPPTIQDGVLLAQIAAVIVAGRTDQATGPAGGQAPDERRAS